MPRSRQTPRPTKRRYESPLRAAQRESTRQAIVAAAHALLKTAPDELTVAAIAARAGVSVPTVNRHFPSRQALLEGIVAHLDAETGLEPSAPEDPSTYFTTGLEPLLREMCAKFSGVTLPSPTNAVLGELRSKVTIPRRRRLTDDAIARLLPDLGEPHRTWLSDLLVVLLSSSMVHTMQSYLGLPPEESAARMQWLVSALLADAERKRGTRGAKTRPKGEKGARR